MAYSLVLHLQNEDAVLGEVEELPKPSDSSVTLTNPRRLDGKELFYIQENVVTVMWPMHRINFIEVVPSKEEEEIFGFVRE